jgi:hypothetical protein
MTDRPETPEERRARIAGKVIAEHLERALSNATGDEEEHAAERVARWQDEQTVDDETARAIAEEVLQPLRDAEQLLAHPDAGAADADAVHQARYRAAATREWLREEGHDIPLEVPGIGPL